LGKRPTIGLIVGLGNPGAQYARTRHNAGFWFLDALAERCAATFRTESRFKGEIARASIDGNSVWLLKPDTYMNDSGQSVGPCASYYKLSPEQTLVAHDELSLACGKLALKRGGGHGGHNGLRDITRHFGADFVRARIGIARPPDGQDVARYVLGTPPASERDQMMEAIDAALDEIERIVAGDVERAVSGNRKLAK